MNWPKTLEFVFIQLMIIIRSIVAFNVPRNMQAGCHYECDTSSPPSVAAIARRSSDTVHIFEKVGQYSR